MNYRIIVPVDSRKLSISFEDLEDHIEMAIAKGIGGRKFADNGFTIIVHQFIPSVEREGSVDTRFPFDCSYPAEELGMDVDLLAQEALNAVYRV